MADTSIGPGSVLPPSLAALTPETTLHSLECHIKGTTQHGLFGLLSTRPVYFDIRLVACINILFLLIAERS